MTGSGKTTLARLLLEPFPYVACIDPKGLLDWPGYERHTQLRTLVKSNHPRLNFAPEAEELRNPEIIEAFFRFVYLRQNTFLYVDEVYAVAYRNEIPPHYHSILTRGRERGNGLLSATQRPMQIPTVIMSEAESWYVFRLSMEGDRKKVEQSIGLNSEEIRKLPKHKFIYSRVDEDIQTPPLMIKLKGRKEAA